MVQLQLNGMSIVRLKKRNGGLVKQNDSGTQRMDCYCYVGVYWSGNKVRTIIKLQGESATQCHVASTVLVLYGAVISTVPVI